VLDRRRSTNTCTSSSTCIITAINIDRSSSSTATAIEQCLAAERQVVLVATREPTGPKVVVDGVLLHVIHHDNLVLQPASAVPFLNDKRPRASSARDLQANKQEASLGR
jgi:hypothetical protein